jgi:hypothetical protein
MVHRMFVAVAFAAVCTVAGIAGAGPDSAPAPDLNGQWRLDPRHSDSIPQPGAEGGRRGGREGGGGSGWGGGGGGMGGGGWGGGHRRGGGPGGSGEAGGGEARDAGARPGGARPVRYPDLLHVTQTGTIVSIEDSTGAVLQEITMLGGAKDTLAHAPGAQVVAGAWKDGALEITRPGPRGGSITQTLSLGDKGASLVVLTRIALGADEPPREFKRVYQRVVETQ